MSTPHRREHPKMQNENPSTYLVQDRFNQEELTRLQIQGQMFTDGMGGALSEQSDPSQYKRVLDVGCATGNWLIEAARTYPDIESLVGVDVSQIFIKYAQEQAASQQMSNRVEFHVMDALRPLEFPDHSFDLLNQRGGTSWLRTWDWPNVLNEYFRVVQAGGMIRITETESVTSSSPAFTQFGTLLTQALYQAGYDFRPDTVGVIEELAPLLSRHGLQQVQTRTYELSYSMGTPEWQRFFEDTKHFLNTYLPFLQRWVHVPDNYQEICEQVLSELQQPNCVATWKLVTVWGITR